MDTTALFPGLAESLELPVEEELLIERVVAGSPAARAGLRGGTRTVIAGMRRILVGGDVLVAFDGRPVTNQLDMNRLLNRKRPGEGVRLTIYRGRQRADVDGTLGER